MNDNPEDRIEAMWCIDSETGEMVLVNCLTHQIIARKDEAGNII